jgi:hypothetical protein
MVWDGLHRNEAMHRRRRRRLGTRPGPLDELGANLPWRRERFVPLLTRAPEGLRDQTLFVGRDRDARARKMQLTRHRNDVPALPDFDARNRELVVWRGLGHVHLRAVEPNKEMHQLDARREHGPRAPRTDTERLQRYAVSQRTRRFTRTTRNHGEHGLRHRRH